MATYHEEAGKGSHRRKEDKQKFEKNFDGIDWSVKASDKTKTCIKCPQNESVRCDYCGLLQSDGSVMNLVVAVSSEGQ